MTAIRGYVAPTTNADALGVHSLDQFVLAVPDAAVAQDFYGNFGLDVRRDGNALAIKTFGHEHRWGSVVEGTKAKALHHLSFGCYADDLPRLKARIEEQGVTLIDPPPGFESNGFWFRNHEGVLIEVKVGPKVSPDRKSESHWVSVPAGKAGAGVRAAAPPVRLVFAGEGTMRPELEARAKSMGIQDRVRFLGFVNQSQLPAVYAASDLLVLPSGHEPWGLVVNEAMSCGLPAVVSDRVGASLDLIAPGVTGDVYPSGDVEALANILSRMIADPARIRSMGRAARARMETWSYREHTKGMMGAIEEAVEAKRRS